MNAWRCEVFVDESPGSGNPALVISQLPVVGRDDYPVRSRGTTAWVTGVGPCSTSAPCIAQRANQRRSSSPRSSTASRLAELAVPITM